MRFNEHYLFEVILTCLYLHIICLDDLSKGGEGETNGKIFLWMIIKMEKICIFYKTIILVEKILCNFSRGKKFWLYGDYFWTWNGLIINIFYCHVFLERIAFTMMSLDFFTLTWNIVLTKYALSPGYNNQST